MEFEECGFCHPRDSKGCKNHTVMHTFEVVLCLFSDPQVDSQSKLFPV